MKYIIKSLAFSICFLFSANAFAVNTMANQSAVETYLFQNELEANDFLSLSTKDIRKATQKRLTFKEHIVFRVMKAKMFLKVRNGEEFDAEEYYKTGASDFNIGGFLLGFFLPIIGNLIALLFGGNAFKWSLIGTLTSIIAGIIAWIL
ncbi:hypothetical protein [Portibacter lacus]|nr:hypothetical protein [Portibacter lacus]